MKKTSRRRKPTARRRKNSTRSKASRRRAALLGIRRKKARGGRKTSSRRKRNPRGLFKTKRATSRRVRIGRKKNGRYSRRARPKRTLYSHPGRKLAAKRSSSRRRRNPSGFLGSMTKAATWKNAGSIALGAVGSITVAGWAYDRFAPAALQAPGIRMVGRPVSMAVAGGLIGWGLNQFGMKSLGKSVALGGAVAAAIDVVTQIGQKFGLLGYSDYVQLQGLGNQAQVEAGEFGDYIQLGTQAQVEAGDFSGFGEEETAAYSTFGPTF